MTQIMNASQIKEITDGQIESAVNQLRDAMRKNRSEISSDVAQQVLGLENLGMQMFMPFRTHAEMISSLIVRRVFVTRTREPQEVLDATRRKQYTDKDVVNAMPHGVGEEGEESKVFFFNLGRYVSDDDLEKEYELRGLKPADPYSLAVINQAEPAFADTRPNGTHWKDAEGKWCFATFNRWIVERSVNVNRIGSDWYDIWWFAGLRK